MPVLHLAGEVYSLFIMQDIFSSLNVVIMVVHDDPSQPVETFVVPREMLSRLIEVKSAKS